MANQATTAYELRDTGNPLNGGGFAWTLLGKKTSYKFTLSASGTGEYYVEALAGGDPSIASVASLFLDGKHNLASQGTVGSLAASEWDYGDNDTLGYSTPYVRLADDTDPDSKGPYFVGIGMGGGQDFSQQAAAEATFTNLSTNVAGTLLTDDDSNGYFTALMVYNIIYIASGTGFTPGWYTIVAYTDTNNVTLDRSAGASATAGAGKVGGAISVVTTALFTNFIMSSTICNKAYIKGAGTFVSTANISVTKDGTTTARPHLEAYTNTRGNIPTIEADMPVISGGAYYTQFSGADYWSLTGIKCTTTTGSYGLRNSGNSPIVRFCVGENESGSGWGLEVSGRTDEIGVVEDCIGRADTAPYAIWISHANVNRCVADGGATAAVNLQRGSIFNSIIKDSPIGIVALHLARFISRNTILNCSTYGIDASDFRGSATHNIIASCGTGVYSDNASYITDESANIDRNAYWDCTLNRDGVSPGANDIEGVDPGFADAPDDLNTGDGMLVTIVSIDELTTTKIRLGAVENNSAGGGGSFGYVS